MLILFELVWDGHCLFTILSCVWLEGDRQPIDSGNYVGKFALLNRSDIGDEDEDDNDNDHDFYDSDNSDGFTDVARVCLILLHA